MENTREKQIRFWSDLAIEYLSWQEMFDKKNPYYEKFPDFQWFKGGKINFCVNCVDRNLKNPNNTAIIWVPEPLSQKTIRISYAELYDKVCKFANVLKSNGIKKGDVVTIYLPIIPEIVISMLACARIGAIHSIVSPVFSSMELKKRINLSNSKILITSDGYHKRGKIENLFLKAKKASRGTSIKKIFIVNRIGKNIEGFRVLDFHKEHVKAQSFCKPEILDSNHELFIMYKPDKEGKLIKFSYSTAGYSLFSSYFLSSNFNVGNKDIVWCTSEPGLIEGHAYSITAPLLLGSTTLLYEGSADYPDPGRWWRIIQENRVSVFYTSSDSINLFSNFPLRWIKKHDLSSLKSIGFYGEPLKKEKLLWFFKNIGQGKCPFISSWPSAELGGCLISYKSEKKPVDFSGVESKGVSLKVIGEKNKFISKGTGFLVQKSPFSPSTPLIDSSHISAFFKRVSNQNLYFTGDKVDINKCFFRIIPREDYVRVAGHDFSLTQIENFIKLHKKVLDCCVFVSRDFLDIQLPIALVVLKKGKPSKRIEEKIKKIISKNISPLAVPYKINFVEKTFSRQDKSLFI